jgi:hypothetical protein
MIKFIPILFAIIFLSGCAQQQDGIVSSCTQLCRQEKNKGTDLSAGPCLSNSIAEDWVCDVAHSPREDVDNLPENQCSAFGKTANHFVEVDVNCSLIKKY